MKETLLKYEQKYHVYRYMDAVTKEVLYIGSAIGRLDSRLTRHKSGNLKVDKEIVNHSYYVEYFECGCLQEMDVLETYLIDIVRPLYNQRIDKYTRLFRSTFSNIPEWIHYDDISYKEDFKSYIANLNKNRSKKRSRESYVPRNVRDNNLNKQQNINS